MKALFCKIKILFPVLFLVIFSELKADNHSINNVSTKNSEFLIESNKQSSDMKNSVFYAEGDVLITNTNKKFIAKSNKAIFYKSSGKIKLIGDVEILSNDINKIKAGEILYYLNENKFEAFSNKDQRVNTKFVFNENNISSESVKK